jgi:hypothetical protein
LFWTASAIEERKFMLKVATAVIIVIGFASPLAAAPCTNNNWQPTFDLDNEDGPYYVTSSLSFLKLRWQQNGRMQTPAVTIVPEKRDVSSTDSTAGV